MRTMWVAGASIVGKWMPFHKATPVQLHNPNFVFSNRADTAESIINSKDMMYGVCYGTFSLSIERCTFVIGIVSHGRLMPNTVTLVEYHSGLPVVTTAFQGIIPDNITQGEVIRMVAHTEWKKSVSLLHDICAQCQRVNHL